MALGLRYRFLRLSRRKRLACLGFTLAVFYLLYALLQWASIGKVVENLALNCEKLKAREKLESLCTGYRGGLVGGNLCHELCNTKDLILPQCLAHKNTTIVFTGKWRGINVVLKTKEGSHHQNINEILFGVEDKVIQTDLAKVIKDFSLHLLQYVKNDIKRQDLDKHLTPKEFLEKLYHPHPVDKLTLADIRSLWELIHNHEFVKLQLLEGLEHIPKVYGFCGSYYMTEKADSLENFFTPFARPHAWHERANIAKEVLELFMEFQKTSMGELVHCDIQPGNFGVNDKGKVLAIDVDTVFNMQQKDEVMGQGKCSKDDDCSFFDCVSACNKAAGTCSSTMISNNLHIICRDIFLVNSWVMPGLLNMSPIYAANELKPVLQKCAAGETLPWGTDKETALYKELHGLLSTNLE